MAEVSMKAYKDFVDNDIYFMEVVSDKIIVNDNYTGIIILDHQFNLITKINLFDELSIYASFVKSKEVILYCDENNCLIHLNLDSYEHKIFSLDDCLRNVVVLSMYKWVDNDIFLALNNGFGLIHVNLSANTVQTIQQNTTDKLYHPIFHSWSKLQKYTVHKMYHDNAIVESNNKIILFDYKSDTKGLLNIELIDFHDIELKSDCVVQISEEKVMVCYNTKNILLYPQSADYSFLRAGFITDRNKDYLLLLSSNKTDCTQNRIEKYDINSL